MIRDKIFRLNRHRSSLSSFDGSAGQKFDFSFSNIQALQVPKGWDRLVLSMVSSESGKTVRKSGKVQVKNGTCQWTETLSESIWISDVNSSKETDEYLLKFIISTGSSKSGVLGETTLNLATFLSSQSPILVPLSLQKCSYGTFLQVEVTCLTPKTDLLSHEKWRAVPEVESRSSSSSNFCNLSHPAELMSFSPSVSRYSFDSTDDNSMGRQSPSSQSDQNGCSNIMGRQDSVESSDGASYSPYSTMKSVRSVQGPFTRDKNGKSQRQELEVEARMWEQNARKLSQDLESTRKELSASHTECEKLSQEIERLKSLSESAPKRTTRRYSEIRGMASSDMQKELEDEMRFQIEQNEHMSIQLKKTQESNIELIALLREMEETMEKQKHELERYEEMELDYTKSKNDCRNDESDELVSIIDEVSAEEVKSFHELLNLQDLLQSSQDRILFLENTLEDKIIENELEQDLRNHVLKRALLEFSDRLDYKEQKIMNNEAATALLNALSDGNLNESEQGDHGEHGKEIELLTAEIGELETDCSEKCKSPNDEPPPTDVQRPRDETLEYGSTVVDPNMDSLERRRGIMVPSYCHETTERDCTNCTSDCFSRSLSDAVLYSSSSTSSHISDNNVEEINAQWSKYLAELEEENVYLTQRVYGLEAQLRYLTDAKESCSLELQHSGHQVMVLRSQLGRLEEEIESQKLNANEKLQGMETQWAEARDECESLGKLNLKLQTTTETLVDECSLLQKLVEKMKDQKLKLEDRCRFLEAEARKFEEGCCSCTVTTIEESRHKLLVNELESKLRDSELTRVRLAEENYMLRMQLQKVPELQNEVLELRVSLKKTMSETQLLRVSLESLSEDYENLKREQLSTVEKLQCTREAASEAEDCRWRKSALEEKVLRLEGDLIGRDQLCVRGAEMKHELSRMKISNSQLVMKVKHLEEAMEHLQCKLQLCEDRRTHAEKSHRKSTSEPQDSDYYFVPEEEQRNSTIYPSESNKHMKVQEDNNGQVQHVLQFSNKQSGDSMRSHVPEKDCEARIGFPQNELSEDLQVQAVVSEESGSKETTGAAEAQHKISLLEAELQELRERYLQMSLKYAQVEARRERLVMKVKALSS